MIDGLTVEEVTREQLEEHIARLREELHREREEKNYFQVERDKIRCFFEITERQLEETKAGPKNLNKKIEEGERDHQDEIKLYMLKMKHALFEHQNTITELQAEAKVSTEAVQRDQQLLETKLQEEMDDISVNMEKLDFSDLVKELELKHQEKMSETREHWVKQLQDAENMYEGKMEDFLQELEHMRKKEISEREDQRNSHAIGLEKGHREALQKIKELMEAMVSENSIESLKAEKEELEEMIKRRSMECLRILQENECLSECLLKINKEVAADQKRVSNFRLEKTDMEKDCQKELHELKNNLEELEQKFREVQKEIGKLKETITQKIQEQEQRESLKDEEQERKMKTVTDRLEEVQAQLNSMLSDPNADQTALRGFAKQTEEDFDHSKKNIEDLKHDTELIYKALEDLMLHCQVAQ
ncbi:dynein regulatory complex subunit 4-like isoform X2 [Cheilinus undulatus]|nr:dynein regulatory complex subunit 4-like isoform X2 [Cheilinus undulatus]XP_041667786.1 dynein regulatory complex subunit 4-like isoform X2 [Cheilinus undulatus]XP_041667787.1 dynein regulatory complex subunit 4-like isoform X2 [Cheilinus undulatus]